jgi:phytoene synthase
VQLREGTWPGYAPWAETVRDCRREFVRVARSFWLIPELIPLPARDDVAILYCVCRRLDDAVDEAGGATEARAALTRWREELAGRAAPRPLVAAFLAGAPRTGLPLACVDYLLDGLEFDLGPVRVADDEELLRYAYRVSAAVGLMVAPLVGVRGPPAEQRVLDLGLALQISNVLYVRGDARRDRVYLPTARLAAVGLRPEDVLASPGDLRLLPVLRGLASLADAYYRSAALGAAFMPLRYRHGVILFARTYRALGWRAARGDAVPEMPRHLPFATKALRLAELFVTAWDPRTLGLRSAPPHDPALHWALSGWPGAHAAPAPGCAHPGG